jgi:hypothetical protein
MIIIEGKECETPDIKFSFIIEEGSFKIFLYNIGFWDSVIMEIFLVYKLSDFSEFLHNNNAVSSISAFTRFNDPDIFIFFGDFFFIFW